jgi:dGTPase
MDQWDTRIFFDRRRSAEDRCEYSRDRARIIHSSAFRRLQGKTQVFGLGESDFYRTRLTHSMEVAQISSGLVNKLRVTNPENKEYFPCQNLIEAIGLAHDIGHPPFGHGGEKALNYCLEKEGSGFEGNAQTYRICTLLGEHSSGDGFNLTRRTLLGLIKYPIELKTAKNSTIYVGNEAPLKIDSFKPPKCLYEFDRTFEWIMEQMSQSDKKLFFQFDVYTHDHHKSKYKSFDCSIMELADDISYGIHDLEDAIALGFINKDIWNQEVIELMKGVNTNLKIKLSKKRVTDDLFSGSSNKRKRVISDLIFYFIQSVELKEQKIFENKILDYQAVFPDHIKKELEIFQNLIIKHVIKDKNVQMLEYCGEQLVIKLFQAICANPDRLLAKDFHEVYHENKDVRIIADYISGMTDSYAVMIYNQIFSPGQGSMFKKL